jgi:hypothetical protein
LLAEVVASRAAAQEALHDLWQTRIRACWKSLRDLIKTSLLQYDVQPEPLLIVAVKLADSRFRSAAAFHALSNAHLCFAVSQII